MKMLPFNLQKAVYDLLANDIELLAVVTGVYDNPISPIAYPYLALGEVSGKDWSTKTAQGMQVALALHAYSQVSRKEVLEVLDRVFDLLQSGGLALEEHELVAMRFDYSEIGLEKDGVTYHGVIGFKAYAELVA